MRGRPPKTRSPFGRAFVESVILAQYELDVPRAEVAAFLGVDIQVVDYVRRKHGVPTQGRRRGPSVVTHCVRGHRMTERGDFYLVNTSRQGIVRRCRECKRIQNAKRDRSSPNSKAGLIATAHHSKATR